MPDPSETTHAQRPAPTSRTGSVGEGEALRGARIVIVADELLYGRALGRLIESVGRTEVRVVGAVADIATALERAVADVVVWLADTVDDETTAPLRDVRARWPELGLVVVGRGIDPATLTALLSADPHGFAFVQRGSGTQLADVEVAVRQVIRGHSSFDASVMDQLVAGHEDRDGRLAELNAGELTVLGLIAQGLRNEEIARRIGRSVKTVEKHVGRIFEKFDLDAARDPHIERRVAAALVYLDEQPPVTGARDG